MGTNENPPMKYATDVNDNATVNTGGSQDRARLGGDTDKDPDITGKKFDREHNTLTYGNRDASGNIVEAGQGEPARDQSVSSNQATGSRGDATRGPTTKPQ